MKYSLQEWYGPQPVTALSHPLTKMAGEFRFKGKIWPNEDDLSEVVDTEGTATTTLVADGRFIHIDWKGRAHGDSWSGVHIFGYDSGHSSPQGKRGIKEVHFNSLGNFGVGKSDYDGKANHLEIHGETHECSRGVEKYRTIFVVVNDNEFKLEVHMTGRNGKESKARELTFTRA